ncbi:UDP-N-acetylmuramoyl-tripeptide--D-alanyl-D-alanine ligase [Opitutus sp. ER46]|uniref:UDP-N-acetylmuramoyl-tripeptide--D-alanyl-D- alanine ligase n=1 Tax=Opitutus sp. ER46 TaxID=2161864 RepID=UPI000D2FC9E0|nr:UDP-N-acetylmuramoyl-tripeptide--D-alanyl-D-alanine ligase [Opitutus sp. ER46]PTX90792.1 UDP-N-acetylmuramoyl-tripeptide--D-alanyl-D-alanine ligase [Opitutus sp. ER46]
MPAFSAQDLATWTGGRWTTPPAGPLARAGFCVDSRQLRAGQVFVAIKTPKRDGHDFLGAAAAAGADAAIVAAANPEMALPQLVVADPVGAFQAIAREHRRRFRGRVVGISGSAGKTSTKELLALLLGGSAFGVTATEDHSSTSGSGAAAFTGRVLATQGNLNNHLGVPLTLTRLDSDAHDFAVVEAGISAPGEMRPLAGMIEPDVALITLVAPAHTQELGGLEGVAREKAQLPAAVRTAGVAVFSRETARFPAFRELGVGTMVIERADVLRPAAAPKDTVYFTLTQRADQTAVALAYGVPPPLAFTFRRVSDGMAQNAVLAICTALWLGVPAAVIQARLGAWQPAPLRGEIRHEHGRLLYADCYNANPASMVDALEVFAAIAPAHEPRLFVLGCMEELGDESPRYHRELGRALELRPDDQAFIIGTHAQEVIEGAVEAGTPTRQLHVAASAKAIADSVRWWRGAVFVKGSRRYQLEQVFAAEEGSPAAAGAH